MASGEGEESGPQVGPFVPDVAVQAPSDVSEVDSAVSPVNSATQQLRLVRSEGAPVAPIVRAVAKRVASALPALGRADGITDTPRSARATAGRRRRDAAQAQAAAPTSGAPTAATATPKRAASVASVEPVGARPPEIPVVEEPVVAAPPVDGLVLDDLAAPELVVAEPVAQEPILEVTEPVAAAAAETVRAVELVLEPLVVAEAVPVFDLAPTPKIPAQRVGLEPVALVERSRSHGMPVSDGGEVSAPPLMGQPAPLASGDVLEAEILDDEPPSRTSVNAAAAEVLTALTEVAFREARTDEWIMGQPEHVVEPSSALELVRPGPRVLDADSWDPELLPAAEHDSYQGRRRATAPSGKLWLVIGMVIAALSAAIAIPFLLTAGAPAPATARSPEDRVPFSEPGDISGVSSPALTASASQLGLPVVGASPLITPSPTPSPTPPPFLLTIQAEQGTTATSWLAPAAQVTSNGVTVIDKIGDWPETTTDTWLDFNNITVPTTGDYSVTIYYVYTTQNPDPSTRRIWFRANSGSTYTNEPVFTFTSTPTARKLYHIVTFQAGSANKIRFSNSSSQAPAIDRIEITKA